MFKLISSVLVAAAFAAPFAANAADIERSQALSFIDGSTGFSDGFGASAYKKSFVDSFTFTVGSTFDVTSAVISIKSGNSLGLNINGLTLTSSNGQTYAGTAIASPVPGVTSWMLSTDGLLAGNYTLNVIGSVIGKNGGSFGGNVNITSAVPEASTYALMLSGIALVGGIAYRRKSKTAAPALPNAAMFA